MRKYWNVFVLTLLSQNYLAKGQSLDKVDTELRTLLEDKMEANILIWFGSTELALERANKSMRKTISNPKAIVAKSVYESLNDLADKQQAGVLQILTNTSDKSMSDIEFERLWITNRIFIKEADIYIVERVAGDPNVTRISQEVIFKMDEATVTQTETKKLKNITERIFTWGLQKIEVPEAWEIVGGMEKAGLGVVVGIMDTGCNVEHERVGENFVGEFGWFDPIHLQNEPEDMKGHGSHVTGTIVGKNGIGIAPAAKHSQCRVCGNYCTEKNLDRCAQFFICPSLPNGTKEDCSRRVDVVNMSFDFGPLPKYKDVISAFRSAGIIPVASAGNKGPNCSTINFPGTIKQDVIIVGNTDENDKVFESSSRGPVSQPDIKPDVCAPGTDVASVGFDKLPNGLRSKTGSSMAAAHVTGLVALLLGKDKNLRFDKVRKLIVENTDTNLVTSGEKCGGILDSVYPNNVCGYGRINVLKVLKAQSKMPTG